MSSEQREVSPNKHGAWMQKGETPHYRLQLELVEPGTHRLTSCLPILEMKLKKRKRKWIGPTLHPQMNYLNPTPSLYKLKLLELKRQVVSLNCEDQGRRSFCLHLWAQVWSSKSGPSQPAAKRGNKDHGNGRETANVTH